MIVLLMTELYKMSSLFLTTIVTLYPHSIKYKKYESEIISISIFMLRSV